MHDDRTLVEARLKRVLDERIRPAVHPESVPLDVAVWTAPGEPVPVAEGLAAPAASIAVGDRWGAPWGTSWFRVSGTVPQAWAGRTVEALLDLGFDENMPGFQCEGLVYRPDGTPVKGLNPRNQWVRIGAPVAGGEDVLLHIEAASNPVILDYHPFLPTQLGDKETAGSEPQYTLARMDLAVFDENVWNLVQDLEVLGELMTELPVEGARRWDVLRAVGRALDRVDLQDVNGTAAAARAELATVLAAPAEPSAHRISAVGHAHIDSAWLWPLRETVRKVARTTSNMTALLEDEPDFVFAMSQAQQFAWIKEHRPEVYAKVKKAVADGRFVPSGGMWVESDTNMPGSEAMARQFVHGKRFFLDEFGVENDEAWLPDTFGFAAGLPQIIKAMRLQVAAHAEDLVEPDQQVPAPHLPVGRHRRHPDLHPLPARRHLQLLDEGQRDRPRGEELQGQGRRPALPRADRLGRRRRRHHARDGREGGQDAQPRRVGHRDLGDARRVLHQGGGGVPERPGVGR